MRKARALTANQYSSTSDPDATCPATQRTPLFIPDPADVEQKLSEKLLADFLPKEQAAAELHVCERTLDRWRRLGEGPPVTKIGRRIYYRRPTLRAWLCAHEERGRVW
jgi:Helix-turn-helix domain